MFRWITALLLLVTMAALTGCQILGFAATAIPPSADAEYKGLAGQNVSVMVWADRGLRIDYPNLQLDTGNAFQAILISKTKEDSLKKTQFPWEVRSVLRVQKEHPEYEGRSVTEYAHRISGISRLIYIEIVDFSTRSETAVQLLRGTMMVNIKVLEIGKGSSKIVYEKQNQRVQFPKKSPEGVLDVPEAVIYSGTVRAMAQQAAELFYPHIIEE